MHYVSRNERLIASPWLPASQKEVLLSSVFRPIGPFFEALAPSNVTTHVRQQEAPDAGATSRAAPLQHPKRTFVNERRCRGTTSEPNNQSRRCERERWLRYFSYVFSSSNPHSTKGFTCRSPDPTLIGMPYRDVVGGNFLSSGAKNPAHSSSIAILPEQICTSSIFVPTTVGPLRRFTEGAGSGARRKLPISGQPRMRVLCHARLGFRAPWSPVSHAQWLVEETSTAFPAPLPPLLGIMKSRESESALSFFTKASPPSSSANDQRVHSHKSRGVHGAETTKNGAEGKRSLSSSLPWGAESPTS